MLVDWSLLEHTLSSSTPTYPMWLSKFASGHSAVGTIMAYWKWWVSPVFPLCHLDNKSTLHMLQCPEVSCRAKWHQLIVELTLWLAQLDTHLEITQCLTTTLHSCGLLPFSSTDYPSCSLATQEQESIGFLGSPLDVYPPNGSPSKQAIGELREVLSSQNSGPSPLCQWLLHITHATWVFQNQQIQSHLSKTHIQDI